MSGAIQVRRRRARYYPVVYSGAASTIEISRRIRLSDERLGRDEDKGLPLVGPEADLRRDMEKAVILPQFRQIVALPAEIHHQIAAAYWKTKGADHRNPIQTLLNFGRQF